MASETENHGWLQEEDMLHEISPLGGYAHGNYIAYCHWCRRNFAGDKRATQCLPCAVKYYVLPAPENEEPTNA